MSDSENDFEQPTVAPGDAALAAAGESPRQPLRSKLAAVAAASVAGALIAAAAGAVVGHELWSSGSAASSAAARTATRSSFGGSPYRGYADGPGLQLPLGGTSSVSGSSTSATTATSTASAAVAAKVDPGLVDIDVSLGYESAEAAGTGVVLTSNGEVLTNNHVIDGATKITATDIGNGKTYTATVVGYDPSSDIAVIQLKNASGLSTATIGDSSKATVGEAVVGIGNAGGAGGTPSSAAGSITGLDKSITASDDLGGTSEQLKGLLQTNAGIQPGDSGGPLVDTTGDVLGIDTAGSQSYSFEQATTTQAFAIPINHAIEIAKEIESGTGSTTLHIGATAFLGISVASTESAGGYGGYGGGEFSPGASSAATVSGVPIQAVLGGKPAETAGLAAGDTLTSLDGKTVASRTALSNLLLTTHPGDTAKLGWTDSSGQTHTASVKLASGPPA